MRTRRRRRRRLKNIYIIGRIRIRMKVFIKHKILSLETF